MPLTQIIIHSNHAHRRPKKVYRSLSGIQALKPNHKGFTHQATAVYNKLERRVFLNAKGEWHCFLARSFHVEVKEDPP